MNFKPAPARTGDDKRDLDALFEWAQSIEEFLKFPVFELIRLKARAAPTVGEGIIEGTIYQDSTGHVLKARNAAAFTDCNT